jgi:protein involved in polysaccharide export with SLBB domain
MSLKATRSSGLNLPVSAVIAAFIIFNFAANLRAQNPILPGETDKNENYQIGIGDTLKVVVVKQDLLTVDGVRVSNRGAIRLPMLNEDLPAACLTETELASSITEKYKKYLLNPQVYVAVKEFNSNPVAVVGAVLTPGRFQLQRPMRLLELITFVNGPAQNAGKEIKIIRNPTAKRCSLNAEAQPNAPNSSGEEVMLLPLVEVLKGEETVNPYILAGDIVQVSEAQIVQAFVVGSVKSAAIISLKEPVTLTKAIAMAGGTAQGAQIEKIKISRQLSNSLSKTELVVNLKEINRHKQEDIVLQPNDIIDVPGESGKIKFLKDVFRTTVPIVTRVPVVIP